MGIGGSIFLIAVGAILAWAVHLSVGWLDLRVVGYVLMVAGAVGLMLTWWYWNSRRQVPSSTRVERERYYPQEETVTRTEVDRTPDW